MNLKRKFDSMLHTFERENIGHAIDRNYAFLKNKIARLFGDHH